MRKGLLNSSCLVLALAGMLQNSVAFAGALAGPVLVAQPTTTTAGADELRDPSAQTPLPPAVKLKLLQQKIKYVFVLFQENRAFDHYFAGYPGVDGLFTAPGVPNTAAAGYTQKLVNTDGSVGTISPFLATRTITDVNGNPVQLYPESIYSVDHSHSGMANGMHFNTTQTKPTAAANDSYALDNEGLGQADTGFTVGSTTYPAGTVVKNPLNTPGVTFGNSAQPYALPTSNPSLATKQKGEVVMAHIDCDTIPFLWNFADKFTLFDNFHQTTIGPSTPNAIAMIAGQSGETQWALHPSLGNAYNSGATRTGSDGKTYTKPAFPIIADPGPFPGSGFDTVNNPAGPKPPYNPGDENPANPTVDLTFASLPLSFMGSNIDNVIATDENPTLDLIDVQHDIAEVKAHNPVVNWTWYEQGYDTEPFDGTTTTYGSGNSVVSVKHTPQSSYIIHHNGAQYFGYIADNPQGQQHLKGLGDFFTDMANQALPANGGVFYVRGGYFNNLNMTPLDPTPAIQASFAGNDDHGSYADSQLSEAQVAEAVNAIASSPYWSQSAIIITYDETDGFYDHAQPAIRAWDPVGVPMTGGPRIPAIVISPYSAAHTISHQYSEHSSVIRFLDLLEGVIPLAQLPDEKRARRAGMTALGQPQLGPADSYVPNMGSLFEAFDNDRLTGRAKPLPASYAMIGDGVVNSTLTTLPHLGDHACKALGMLPLDYATQADYDNNSPIDPPPQDFNPRPTASPGNPYLHETTNPTTSAVTNASAWTP